ncbi:hypothetical protein EW145_g3617 [Phellinidium pouzarii]|uniref:FAD-binding domain-containing protein n=1 Tax=Phellinidium pouzarii TaxID=167371 RepID=A0A4S4L6T1_9AGAM|nr:hypothetical protein EW145_g3617 [Phellinidium pouzarii]
MQNLILGASKLRDHDDPVLTPKLLSFLLKDTNRYWNSWIRKSTYNGSWKEAVHRSALALKLLIFEPTGAVIASPTFSLPEYIGGTRNWFSWIRDSSFTLYALIRLGFTQEANAYMEFIFKRLEGRNPDGSLQIVYTIHGGKNLEEMELSHLDGHKGSKPVRIGNGAADHVQLDIYGELYVSCELIQSSYTLYAVAHPETVASMDCIYLGQKYGTPLSYETWVSVRELSFHHAVLKPFFKRAFSATDVIAHRKESDLSIWVAIDRGLRLADKRSLPCPRRNEWLLARDDLYEEIMTHAWNPEKKFFTQSYEDKETLDSAVLIMPLVFFCAASEERFLSTLRQVLKTPERGGLTANNLVYRYDVSKTDDGVGGEEGTFCLCTLWCVEALTRAGQYDKAMLVKATTMFEDFLQYTNHVGLCTEEISAAGEGLGNAVQGFTHVTLISAAYNLSRTLATVGSPRTEGHDQMGDGSGIVHRAAHGYPFFILSLRCRFFSSLLFKFMSVGSQHIYGGLQTAVRLDILIIGGGIGGLAAALCLGEAGHNVTVFEAVRKPREVGAGVQVSPNVSRLLLRWGLGARLHESAVEPEALVFRRYADGEVLGRSRWGSAVVEEHGAPYLHMHRADLHRALLERVRACPRVSFRASARVRSLDPVPRPRVALELVNGQVFEGDLIIGADGVHSLTRQVVCGRADLAQHTGDAAYRAVIPTKEMKKDPDLKSFVDTPELTTWMGPGRHIMTYCIRAKQEFNIVLLHPDEGAEEDYTAEGDTEKMRQDFVDFEPRVQKLLSLVDQTLRWRLVERMPLETWVHPEGRVALLGDACHPMLPYRAQGAAMAIEDAAVLGSLLLHLEEPAHRHLPRLLAAYESLRLRRTSETQETSALNRMRRAMLADAQTEVETQAHTTSRKNVANANQWADRKKNREQYGYDANAVVDAWLAAEGAAELHELSADASTDGETLSSSGSFSSRRGKSFWRWLSGKKVVTDSG